MKPLSKKLIEKLTMMDNRSYAVYHFWFSSINMSMESIKELEEKNQCVSFNVSFRNEYYFLFDQCNNFLKLTNEIEF